MDLGLGCSVGLSQGLGFRGLGLSQGYVGV